MAAGGGKKFAPTKGGIVKKMDLTEEPTTDTMQYTAEDRQGIVGRYVKQALNMLLEDPWFSLPEITEFLAWVGPLRTSGQNFTVFRGGPIYRRTLERMDRARVAVLRGEEWGLPRTTRLPENAEVGDTIPLYDGYILWWSARVAVDGPPFPVRVIWVEGGGR